MSQRKNKPVSEGGYDFELPRATEEIKKKKAGLVGLQFPEGLKTHAVDIARQIEKETGAKTVTFLGPVYGACDTKEREAQMLGVDLVIHFGHTSLKPRLSK